MLIRTTRQHINGSRADTRENHYYLTSVAAAGKGRGSPQWALEIGRRHWQIENKQHHVRDRSLREDAQRARRAAGVLARLRSLAVGLLACLPGQSVPQKQVALSKNPRKAFQLLVRGPQKTKRDF